MATIPEPLTVFGAASFSPQNLQSSGSKQEFIPPAATWYDEGHQHFVALLDGFTSIPSKTNNPLDSSEVFYFQTLSIPPNNNTIASRSSSSSSTTNNSSKPHTSLSPSSIYTVTLPYRYARRVVSSNPSPANAEIRIPKLAKFSLDMTLLALQLSPFVVRIIHVESNDNKSNRSGRGGSSESSPPKQWTINLANTAHHPSTSISNQSGLLPPSAKKKADAQGGDNGGEPPPPTNILPGGIIWSDHGGNSQDLILVTTTAVLFYKVSIIRNQLAKSRAYTHLSDAFWFEPRSRALLVGTFTAKGIATTDGTSPEEQQKGQSSMIMRTYFLRMPGDDEKGSGVSPNGGGMVSGGIKSLPRLELPPPDVLPLFEIGREKRGWEDVALGENVVVMSDVSLVTMYGEAYCVELKCGDRGDMVNVYHLDKVGRRVYLATMLRMKGQGLSFVTVLDNVLCIHCTASEDSYIYDIADQQRQSVSDPLWRGGFIIDPATKRRCEEMYDGRYTILPPKFMLDPEGHGRIYIPELELSRILSKIPLSHCITPFLLRRQSHPHQSHTIALQRFYIMIQNKDKVSLESSAFSSSVATTYARHRDAHRYDMQHCLPLIFRAALLPSSFTSEPLSKFDPTNEFSICPPPPASCRSVLTQTEILERVLLPHASLALFHQSLSQLECLADITCDMMETFEKHGVSLCPALECFLVALLWRLGRGEQVIALLRSRRPFSSSMGGGSDAADVEGVLAFGNVLLLIAMEVELGVGVGDERVVLTSDDNEETTTAAAVEGARQRQYVRSLTNLAIDIMCSTSRYHAVAKHLLEMDRIMDAITVCTHGITTAAYSATKGGSRQQQQGVPPQGPPYSKKGTTSYDFFRATIAYARTLNNVGERAKLFCHVHTFLSRWDPNCLAVDTTSSPVTTTDDEDDVEAASAQQQSVLASCSPDFPDDLLGGVDSMASSKVRDMFGFPKSMIVTTQANSIKC